MCKVAKSRTCRLLTAAVALLWCTAVVADSGVKQGVNNSVQRGSKLDQIKPVTSDFDIDIDTRYRKDIQKRYAAQDLKMNEALRLMKDQKFNEATRAAEAVRDELKLESEFVKSEVAAARLAEAEALVARVRVAWGRERLKKANEAFLKNQLSEALILAGEAVVIAPSLKADAERVRKLCVASERHTKFQKQTSLSEANPKLANLRKEAQNLLAEAKVFFENKRYDQALDKIEQVYLRDPFNMEAVALAGQIYREFFTTGYYRHRADFELMQAYTIWQWIEPVFEAPEAPKDITVQEKGDSRKAMYDRLVSTVLPSFVWQKGDARGAIALLRKDAKQFGDIDIQDFTTKEDADVLGPVSLNLGQVSVSDVLRYISLMSGVKYRVEPDAVIVGTSVDSLYNRKYEVMPHVRTWIYTHDVENGGSGGGSGSSGSSGGKAGNSSIFKKVGSNTSDSSSSSGNSGSSFKLGGSDSGSDSGTLAASEFVDVDLDEDMFRKYFQDHGIKFTPDSQLSWNQKNGILNVISTREKLDAISQLLREQNALQATLILIETKCIEISDNDMEELGFDWALGDNLSSNMDNSGTIKDASKPKGWMFGPGGEYRPTDNGERGPMNPIRTGFGDGSASAALINNLNIFPMLFGSKTPFGSDVPINISLTVNALSQNTRTEVISAPKVVVMSGLTATANLTKTYYFPEDWEELEIDVETGDNTQNVSIKRPTISGFEEEPIGIQMSATPTLTETGAINLKLDLKVTSINGNDEFAVTVTGYDSKGPVSERYVIWKPVIALRHVNTDVDLYDGQTVVIAGATENRTVTRHDKIPFLGELPFIGRLFQSQSEKAERRNMILFVTGRRLGMDGAAVTNQNQGAPDFSR